LSKKNSSTHILRTYVAAMGLWSYSQLTTLHPAFIKLRFSKFVALASHGCLLARQIGWQIVQPPDLLSR